MIEVKFFICCFFIFRWTIRARVTNKGQIRTWSNSRGEGKLFSIEMVDESVSRLCLNMFLLIELLYGSLG